MIADVNPHLKTIFENASEGFVLLDYNLSIQAFNAKARDIIFINTSKEVRNGASIYKYMLPSRKETMRNIFERVLSGESIEYDHHLVRDDKSVAWFRFSYRPVKDNKIISGICISGMEITSRKEAEEQHGLLVSVVNASQDAIISLNMKGNITSWNNGATQIFGYTESEAIGRHISFLQPESYRKESVEVIERIKNGESLRHFETERSTKDGRLITVSLNLSPIRDVAGISIGISTVLRDVTELKKAEQARLDSETLYRSLFDNSPFPTFVALQTDLRLLKVNQMAVQHYGYSEEELLKMSAFDLRIREEHADLIRILHEGSESIVKNKIVHHRTKSGQVIIVQVALHDIQFDGQPCYLVTINDLTQQLKLEKELTEERLNRQKEITKATIEGQEKQREQIGKELHDNVNQMLASAKMYISSVNGSNPVQVDLVHRSVDAIRSCMDEIRNLSRTLVPPSLGDIGLAEAVEELIQNLEIAETGIRFTTHLFLDENKLPEALKLSAYRIVQEQLSNIMKHAGASNVALQIKQAGNVLHIMISDDGKGFDTTQKRKGIGITNIINRTDFHNGNVKIISSPGSGCTLHVQLEVGEPELLQKS